MSFFSPILSNRLKSLDQDQRRRTLKSKQGIDFSSNDYLGFSQDSDLHALVQEGLSRVPLGASASRLLRGQMDVFAETESLIADFCGREMALLYPSGYQANVGLLTALLTSEDVVFSDQLNHASIIDGIRLSGAQREIFRHSDLEHLESRLKAYVHRDCVKVIVVESLFGMDGDFAPLAQLVELAEKYASLLVVDEAHATGLWGDFVQGRGGGLVQAAGLSNQVFATIHPAGKALGLAGGWICGGHELKDYLVNFSRPFIFSTAPLPILCVFIQAVLSYWKKVGVERARWVLERSVYLRQVISSGLRASCKIPSEKGPIVPVIMGENSRALDMANQMQSFGFDIRAIRPPTVPAGGARVRLTSNLNHSIEDIERLGKVLRELLG